MALVRATHWINVVFLTILLMSGLQIFNAHPALYWGEVSNFGNPALSITAQRTEGGASRGINTVAKRTSQLQVPRSANDPGCVKTPCLL